MSIHEHILGVALRICRERGSWTFGPGEVVAALPDLNPGSVRTQVMSRCCVNAPAHHAHRWPYFRRVRRGVYEILPAWRRPRATQVREAAGKMGMARPDPVVEAYEKDIDRTLVRRRLQMSFEERLLALQTWMRDIEELRGAARSRRRKATR